ncbi:SpoIIE family protein phosphatase [Parabacteroides sp. OttesenSCG-928-N08]|nr:SpoIIE family protein phosphatase [Parabacteroides sp. OttesenSCG-928-N08]
MSFLEKIQKSFSAKLSFFILLFTIGVFLVIFFAFYTYTSRSIRTAAETRANDLLDNVCLQIEDVFTTVKTVPDNILWAVIEKGYEPDSLYSLTRQIIEHNDFVYGTAVAFEPNYFKDKGHYFSPYSYREGGEIYTIQLGTDTYDYHTMDWYLIPKMLGNRYWTEPYFDDGGGEMLMLTYSNPIYDKEGQFVGILTVDVSLDWLTDLVNSVKPYPSAYTILLGREGTYIVHPNKEMILNETLFSVGRRVGSATVDSLGYKMIGGERGMMELSTTPQGKPLEHFIFFKPLTFNNWSLGIVIPKNEIFAELAATNRIIIILILAGLLLLFFFCMLIISRLTKPLKEFSHSARIIAYGNFNAPLPAIKTKDEMGELYSSFSFMQEKLTSYIEELKLTTSTKERIESELRIARDIQMGMIPKIFPPFPERNDVDLYATLQPAKEVGGDLYDFFIESGRLFFAIGDVSGKGVPASLFMAVTRSLFRSVAVHYSNPEMIVSSMNNSMAETNDSNMFVTLFVGILDLRTGWLDYCNAGHNPPVVIAPSGNVDFMNVKSNIPAGLFPDFQFEKGSLLIERGTVIFLYTDGLTEAENKEKELYCEARLLNELRQLETKDPHEMTDAVINSVRKHVDGAEQSDDLTILTIVY